MVRGRKVSNKEVDLEHLQPKPVVVAGKGKDGADLQVRIHFGTHTVSRRCEATEIPNMQDENNRGRIFCEERYSFSLQLPSLMAAMVEENYFCWESQDRNRAVNFAAIDVPRQEVRTLVDGEHRLVYFYLTPSKTDQFHVELYVTSCHVRTVTLQRVKRRFNMHTVLRKCLYDGRRVP